MWQFVFQVWSNQISEIKKFSGPFFHVRRGKFSKSLGSIIFNRTVEHPDMFF